MDVLVSFSEPSGKDLLKVFRKSWCNLKFLQIWCLSDSDLVEDVPPLLAFINGNTTPKDLQSLTLFGVLVYRRTWKDVAFYRHLSWLCLVDWPMKFHTRWPNMESFLDVLESCPLQTVPCKVRSPTVTGQLSPVSRATVFHPYEGSTAVPDSISTQGRCRIPRIAHLLPADCSAHDTCSPGGQRYRRSTSLSTTQSRQHITLTVVWDCRHYVGGRTIRSDSDR